MNKKDWIKYNRNIVNGGNITFNYLQARALVKLLNDVSNFVLLMREDSPKTVNDPEVFWDAFNQLCKTCDKLDTKFIFDLQNRLSGRNN